MINPRVPSDENAGPGGGKAVTQMEAGRSAGIPPPHPASAASQRWQALGRRIEAAGNDAGIAFIVTDDPGDILFWSDTAAREWEWREDEVIGQKLKLLLFVDQVQTAQICAEGRQRGVWQGNAATVTKAGRLKLMHAMVTRWEMKSGNGGGWLVCCHPAADHGAGPEAPARMQRVEAFSRAAAGALHLSRKSPAHNS